MTCKEPKELSITFRFRLGCSDLPTFLWTSFLLSSSQTGWSLIKREHQAFLCSTEQQTNHRIEEKYQAMNITQKNMYFRYLF